MALDAFEEDLARPFGVPARRGGGPLKVIATETLSVPGTYARTPPSGATVLRAEGYGSGASGSVNTSGSRGTGGGGGEYASAVLSVQSSDAFSIVVPSGAPGRTTTDQSGLGTVGANATASRNGTTVLKAAGGLRGTAVAGSLPMTSGADSSGTLFDTAIPGSGVIGLATLGPGGKASGPLGGEGGATPAAIRTDGNPGQAPGGGGGNAFVGSGNTTQVTSGAGADGRIILVWYGVA